MTTTNTTTTKPEMTRKALIAKARSLGYRVMISKTTCPDCGGEAIQFNKPNKPYLIACLAGHRNILPKREYKGSPVCRTEGCRVKVGKKQIEENDGYCWKCRPPKGQTTNKPAPKAQPKESNTKEPAQQTAVQM